MSKPTDILKEHFSNYDRHNIKAMLFKQLPLKWIDEIKVIKYSSHFFGLDVVAMGRLHQYEVDTAGIELTMTKINDNA
ncbi:hypothetical protein VCRA2110O318_40041 [Vibrio crassostreae]|nr:hypothetical protein VCRA2117O328_40041 [Vibrio crassostreae]CAK2334944.1 hypothetical protein VCRA2110O318_40041 [Vibrio crassostreae]CAK2503285.1 hypothetical protein VCRA2110O319_50041 [Vibrio crassostreae]CAK2911723.1 hypothetical protein VCRA217O317_30252 [Vibrio crassostreae]